MKAFLKYVARDILEKYGNNLSDIAVVFPNKRAALFLNESLARLTDHPIWSPSYITISDLFRKHSTLKVGDPIKLVCDLHKTFVACTGIDETLDHFYGWGQLLITYFDDIDKNMAEAEKLFANLSNIHELDDISYLTEEQKTLIKKFFSNFNDDHNSELKKRFLQLWSHFLDIYKQFNMRLEEQGLAYEGALYRKVVNDENIKFQHKKYLFVGFNMMQVVERKLCDRLMKEGKAHFYWDYDDYYMQNNHEAILVLHYENMFFMTHEAQYDNMKAFFQTNGYDDIFSQENYPKSEVVNSFGVSDHFEMGYALNTINQKAKTGKPFMATILTVSNHPPYIIPDFFKPKTKEKETQIVEYADWAIGDFLKKASREPWYKNTIFVIQADHGKLVGKSEGELPQSYNHIPLIIFGPGVPQQQYAGLGMQVDVMPTLFGLMNLNYEYEGFGVDLLKQQRPMVFYSADNQIVARDHQRCFVYNPSMNRSFCYDVLPNGNLKETKQESKFQDLKNYVFSNIQAAEYIERHQQ